MNDAMKEYQLTVKHVSSGGTIMLWATTKVTRRENTVEFPSRPDGMVVTVLDDGDVYVMNSDGKTIDRFCLEPGQPRAA